MLGWKRTALPLDRLPLRLTKGPDMAGLYRTADQSPRFADRDQSIHFSVANALYFSIDQVQFPN